MLEARSGHSAIRLAGKACRPSATNHEGKVQKSCFEPFREQPRCWIIGEQRVIIMRWGDVAWCETAFKLYRSHTKPTLQLSFRIVSPEHGSNPPPWPGVPLLNTCNLIVLDSFSLRFAFPRLRRCWLLDLAVLFFFFSFFLRGWLFSFKFDHYLRCLWFPSIVFLCPFFPSFLRLLVLFLE